MFEHTADVQARQALFDLMKIQETFHAENNKYANNLVQIEKHNLKYHTGIVYLEIESAGKNSYRAISLPAESTTARVFAYDTARGGFYEMDEEEVSRYVLGALNYIRGQKERLNTNTLLLSVLLGSLFILGFRFVWRYKGKDNVPSLIAYFASLFPLGWSVTALNRLNDDIVFSDQIVNYSAGAFLLSLASFIITFRWMKSRNLLIIPSPLVGLAGCTLIISFLSAGVVIYLFIRYYPG
ncbi:hypothetical protein UR09_00945 [Candidatus Nitromaritima sp. SCGC AAA799-A02]|nr:hypothetical protein UR09_00945 [Candidatus Nitromaritima sp. SCGC AAA799-A02]